MTTNRIIFRIFAVREKRFKQNYAFKTNLSRVFWFINTLIRKLMVKIFEKGSLNSDF